MRTVLCILMLSLLLVAGATAADGLPALPMELYGAVTLNGAPAPAGTVITAVINSAECGRVTTAVPGFYGWDGTGSGPGQLTSVPTLVVNTPASGTAPFTVTFLVQGVQASQSATFASGESVRLDLTAAGTGTVPPTTPLPTQVYSESSSSSSSSSPGSSSGGGSTDGGSSGYETASDALKTSATPSRIAFPVGMPTAGESAPGAATGTVAAVVTQAAGSETPSEGQPTHAETTKAGSSPLTAAGIVAGAGAVALLLRKRAG